jgi:hypothetical protein
MNPNLDEWEASAHNDFRWLIERIFQFLSAVLALFAFALFLRFAIELPRVLKQPAAPVPAPVAARPAQTAQEKEAAGPNTVENWSPERTSVYLEAYVAGQVNARQSEGKPPAVPLGQFLDFLKGLENGGSLPAETLQAVGQLRQKLTDAAIDVTVDAIKKFTSMLFEKPVKPDKEPGAANGTIGKLSVNVACSGQSTPPKTSPPPKKTTPLVCPVPMVPKIGS